SVGSTRSAHQGPGLAKTRGPSLVAFCEGPLIRTFDAKWRELLQKADSISEGCARYEQTGPVWDGSTSLRVHLPRYPEKRRALFADLAARDHHLKVRALRIALREAATRAPGVLGRSICEMRTGPDRDGIRIDIDVQAPLIERLRLGKVPKP